MHLTCFDHGPSPQKTLMPERFENSCPRSHSICVALDHARIQAMFPNLHRLIIHLPSDIHVGVCCRKTVAKFLPNFKTPRKLHLAPTVRNSRGALGWHPSQAAKAFGFNTAFGIEGGIIAIGPGVRLHFARGRRTRCDALLMLQSNKELAKIVISSAVR